MKKKTKKLVLAKETVRNLAQLAEAWGGGGGAETTAPADTVTYWPEQCTGGSCIPRNC